MVLNVERHVYLRRPRRNGSSPPRAGRGRKLTVREAEASAAGQRAYHALSIRATHVNAEAGKTVGASRRLDR